MTSETPAALAGIEPTAGSSLYYSLLWMHPNRRALTLQTLQLTDTLASVLDEVREPQVAEQKVHWWHEELSRLEQGEPRHPDTVACVAAFGQRAEATGWCLDILSANATRRFTPSSTESEEQALARRDLGARLNLLALGLEGQPGDGTALYLPVLTQGLWLHHQLRQLPRQLQLGHAVFSDERYAATGVEPAALVAAQTSPGDPRVATLLATVVDEATEALTQAMADSALQARIQHTACNPLWRALALRQRQLLLWQKQRPDLLRGTVTLTPIRKFLIARRHRG